MGNVNILGVINGWLCIGQASDEETRPNFIRLEPDQLAALIPVLQRWLDDRDTWDELQLDTSRTPKGAH